MTTSAGWTTLSSTILSVTDSKRADEDAVAFGAFGQPGVAVDRRVGQLLGIEAALGAGRHDHRILDQLRLHQAEDFGAEIVAPVGPAQAAAGDRPAAQMDALDARAVDPDFAIGDRRGKARHLLAVDLERQRLGGGRGEGVGAQASRRPPRASGAGCGRRRSREHPSAHRRTSRRRRRPPRRGRWLAGGVVGRGEQVDQRLGRLGRAGEAHRPRWRGRRQPRSGAGSGTRRAARPPGAVSSPANRTSWLNASFSAWPPSTSAIACSIDVGARHDAHRCRRPAGSSSRQSWICAMRLAVKLGRDFLEHAEAEILQHRDRFGQAGSGRRGDRS